MNAALINGTREHDPTNTSDVAGQIGRAGRRERYQTLLARVRRRQLDLAMAGRVEDSAHYARRASVLAERIVIVFDAATDGQISEPMSHVDEPELECCGV